MTSTLRGWGVEFYSSKDPGFIANPSFISNNISKNIQNYIHLRYFDNTFNTGPVSEVQGILTHKYNNVNFEPRLENNTAISRKHTAKLRVQGYLHKP